MSPNRNTTRLMAILAALFLSAGNTIAAPDISKLEQMVSAQGEIPVIVGLKLPKPFQPEGALSSRAQVAQQRNGIANALEKLYNALNRQDARLYGEWESLPYAAFKVNANGLRGLARSPHVTSIQEDSLSEPLLASSTAHIGADATWDAGYGGLGQTVVILDTGIDADHPFFGGRVVTEACFSAGGGNVSLCPSGSNQAGLGSADANTAQCLNGTANLCTHGSHVAGIAAGQDHPAVSPPTPPGYNGIAPDANIIAIQVFTRFNADSDCNGNAPCVLTYGSDQLSALNYINTTLLTHWPIASANMSLGGDMFTSACDGAALKAAIDNLKSNGVATAIASGNDGWTNALSGPGCISTAVTVGAVEDDDDLRYNMHQVVDLLAPGLSIDSSVPNPAYRNAGGTSMATPMVTGAFAMLKAIDNSMSVDDILSHLQTTGVLVRDERSPKPPDADAGHVKPRIQLDAAVAALTEADLRVFKDCKPDDPMLVTDTATCTITLQNLGPDPALQVTAVDEYLSNGIFDLGGITTTDGDCDSTPNSQDHAGTVTCNILSLGAGETVTIEIDVLANTPQNINDLVTVSALTPDPESNNNYAEDEVNIMEIADLQVFKDCKPDTVMNAGDIGTCFITVKNWGPSVAKGVSLKDIHVSNGTFSIGTVTPGTCVKTPNPQAGSGVVACTLGDLDAGEEVEVTVEVSADIAVNINDTAMAGSNTFDPDIGNNSDRDGVGVAPVADLALTKVASANPVIAGTQLTYTLEVTNNGPSPAENVVIEDVLPAGVSIVSVSSPGNTCNAGVPGDGTQPTTCALNSLAVLATESMTVVVDVDPQTLGVIGNNAETYSDVFDDNNADNLATVAVTVDADADLAVAKSDSPDPVLAGEALTYDVTITNNGPSTAVDVMLADTLPDEVSFQGYTVSNGLGTCVALPGSPVVLECDLNDLDPGEFVTVFITTTVDPTVPDGTTISNSATASAATPDTTGVNDTATQDTLVNAEADLVITKDANLLTDNPSKRIVYTLLVSNTGPSDAQEVVVVDELPLDPQKIVYVMDSGNGACAYDQVDHDVTCDFGTLAAGGSVTVDIVVDARGSVRRITNVAGVSSSTTDPDPLDNEASKEVRIKGGPGKK